MTTLEANEIAFFFSPWSGAGASGDVPVPAVVAAIALLLLVWRYVAGPTRQGTRACTNWQRDLAHSSPAAHSYADRDVSLYRSAYHGAELAEPGAQ
jgi:hypothetical protein